MFARRAQSRFRRESEVNCANAFIHLAPRWEQNARHRKRRAPPVNLKRDVRQRAPGVSLLFRRCDLPVAVRINQREDAIGHLRAGR
jgi:hypothetical protein